MSTPRIVLHGVSKGFPSAPRVLRDINLQVDAGHIFALLGPNGAGKTTLVRILCTLLLPDSGRVEVDGCDAIRDPVGVRRRLGCSLDSDRSFFLRISALENMTFFAALHGMSGPETRRRSMELLESVGLAESARRRVMEFSSGMKQKLALARALLGDPPVLILDEPTRGLDPVATVDFRARVRNLASDAGKSILLVTHSIEEAAEIADQAAVLVAGELHAVTSDWRATLGEQYRALAPLK